VRLAPVILFILASLRKSCYYYAISVAVAPLAAGVKERNETVICDTCGEDRSRRRTIVVAFLNAGWPPIQFRHVCQRCRAELNIGLANRSLFFLCCLVLLTAVAAVGFGAVCLIQWLITHAST